MNGKSQMQGGKTDFAERDECKPVLLRLSLAGNLEKKTLCPSVGRNGGSVVRDSGIAMTKSS